MKKILVLILCFAVLAPSLSFAKKQKTEDVAVESSDSKKSAKQKQKEEKERAKKEAADAKAEEKRQAAEAKKSERDLKSKNWFVITSEEDPSVKKTGIKKRGQNVEVVQDITKVQTLSGNASLLFSVAGKKGSWLPVIDSSDYSDSTYISLFIDQVEYRLNRNKKVDFYFEFDNNSVAVVYTIKKLARLKALYTLNDGIILVSYTLENLDGIRHAFSIKAVYNTILGENHINHFSTSTKNNVGGELVVFPSAKDYLITSSDEKKALRFIIYGEGVTPPRMAVMANKDILENAPANPTFKNGRPFTSVLSYNNSCVGLVWEEVFLKSQAKKSYSYKLKLENFDLLGPEDGLDLLPPVEQPEETAAPVEEKPVEYVPEETPPAPAQEEPKEPENFNDADSSDLRFDFNTERNYLDPSINEEYVRRLIEEIDSLERTDPALNRERIQELQNEIDEVLKVLRSRR